MCRGNSIVTAEEGVCRIIFICALSRAACACGSGIGGGGSLSAHRLVLASKASSVRRMCGTNLFSLSVECYNGVL